MTKLMLWDWSDTLCIDGLLNPVTDFTVGLNCIVSNHTDKDNIIRWCEEVQISQIFPPNQIVCNDNGIKKPDIQLYFKLLKQLGPIEVQGITMIGDSEVDRRFAHNLGATFVHIDNLTRHLQNIKNMV
jgi:phosphoglycolate phosphatase-like HAD superfamily hydrolase